MYAVGRLGSYISRVSAPFHPFGGAVDIVVVEQQDGSFKSSPWYVRFGKFQGVLKAKENVVDINVNGKDADFHMYLDHTGEAYFLREVDAEEDLILSRASSGEEMDGLDRRPMKASSWNDGVDLSDSVTQLEVSNGKVLARTGSRRSRLLGFVFGRRSVKDNTSKEDGVRTDSLERAEIAADLLEVKWSTNLNSVRKEKDNASHLSASDILEGVASKDFLVDEDDGMLDSSVSNMENKAFRRQATVYYETLETSRIELDDFSEQDDETMLLSCVKSGEVSVQAETSTDLELIAEGSELETLNFQGIVGDYDTCCNFFSDGKIHESEITSPQTSRVLTESSSEPVSVEQIDDPAKDVDSCSTLTVSGRRSGSKSEVQDDRCIEKEDEMKGLPFCDSEEASKDFVQTEGVNNCSSLDLEEEQFLFTDLDDFKLREAEYTKVISLDHMDKENDSSLTLEGIETVNKSSHSDLTSPDKFVQGNLPNGGEESNEEAKVISSQINIPRSSEVEGQELGGMVESLPNIRSHSFELDERFLHRPLGHSLDSSSKSSKWTLVRENVSSFIKSEGQTVHNLDSQPTTEDTLNLMELKNVDTGPSVGDSSKIVETSSGSWSIWPFAFKRSRSMKDTQPALSFSRSLDAEISLEDNIVMNEEKELPKSKVNKKNIRVLSPTIEQLASLNLKEGRNIVTFTFSTAMLGKQQVDARIYLWRWDSRVVITDVDGTITKSDVLGQFMPLVGKDWSQTGVAHLFSAIKENGYQLLFLSARAISQAGLTRQFLFNLKQDGKGLPDGPVVISPDGLFPSLFREVIRRAPHEFKIACLKDIKACFPSDRNPFYAGFGNRDTDEFSYLKVGIPKGKIFIINPKGEVVVNRCDNKSYTSLHALVNGMFPPTPSSEQEDFNSWNFWKLPTTLIDI